jgi:peroxiredoxin
LSDPAPLAPDFQLVDTQGYPVTLSTFRGRANVILIFNRGLACPFCRRHLAELRRQSAAFEARHTVILAIDPDRPDQVRDFWKQEDLPFPGFADAGNKLASLYRQPVDMYHAGRLPCAVIIDRSGRIRYRHDGSSAPDVPSPEILLAELDKIDRDTSA